MNNIEKELKVLLNIEQYNMLKNKYIWENEFVQINYYYLDEKNYLKNNNMTVRIRELNDKYKLQIKIPIKECKALHIKNEYELDVERVYNVLPEMLLKEMCGIQTKNVRLVGHLKTYRKTLLLAKDIELCLDKSQYLDKTDYELEIEYQEIMDDKLLDELKQLGLNFDSKVKGKFSRFICNM